ncbi:isoaspartyl peptidase/L-asparaginase [Flavisphingomonas formosensis]|uniref:isoaspartyl peptidase/L-asparaginase n=1 Tax=Flavisphingomonas formosensis TaxID=861534 RepID=UPI0012FA3E99|nr:isoaspartyl peptidase/L-asparaginase [Sphingomonas formosensis]
MVKPWRAAFLALAALLAPAAAHAATPGGYAYYEVGDVAAHTPGRTEAALLLMGGGDWDKRALDWFAAKAGHGHVVVLKASGMGEAGKEFFEDAGSLASVQTIVFDDRKAASDPRVLAIVAHADGIFLGGGDQSKYVRFWKGTPLAKALDAHVARGRPIGGTSAGLAVLGGTAYGAMDGGSIDSMVALADPMGPGVTLVRDFLHMPHLSHVVTDTHFNARDRLGRLIAFVAQARTNGDARAVGLGVDEKGALCVDAQGRGRFFSPDDGHAWLIQPIGLPGTAQLGKPLDWQQVRITGIGGASTIDLRTLAVTDPAFTGTASVKAGRLTGAPLLPGSGWSLAIHGGAGVIPRGSLKPEQEAAYRKGLSDALAAGSAVLRQGGSSLDAVEAAVRVLEDNPLFNAGKGAVFDATGKNQLDAAIMDGATTRAGAVAGATRTKNPISLARAVMEHSRHVLLSGPGADEFSAEQGLEQVDPSYFRTDQRWQDYLEWKRDNHAALNPTHRFGTVGAVARDVRGHVAAATSTGGLTGKRWGRIGDSPIIGAGTYAIDNDCAVSATGTGEYFIRQSAGRQICDRIALKRESVQQAASDTIEAIGDIGGDGGLIAMDGDGHIAFAMNSEGMYRGTASSHMEPRTAIYADEQWTLP